MRLSVPTALLALAGCSQEPSLHDAPSAAHDTDPTPATRSSCGRKISPSVFCRRGCRTPRRHCCCCFGAYVPVIVEWLLDCRVDVDGGCRSRWSPHGGFTRCMADADGDGTHLRQRWRLRWLCCPRFAYRPRAGNVEGQRGARQDLGEPCCASCRNCSGGMRCQCGMAARGRNRPGDLRGGLGVVVAGMGGHAYWTYWIPPAANLPGTIRARCSDLARGSYSHPRGGASPRC